jgi:antitoxin VapB
LKGCCTTLRISHQDIRQVEIIKLGHSRVITPLGRRWDEFFLGGATVADDFMNEKHQPAAEEREPL